MKRALFLSFTATVIVSAFLSQSYAGQYQIKRQIEVVPNLSCTVSGTPVEFPRGIRIKNLSNIPVPAGSKVQYHFMSYYGGITTITVPYIGPKGSYFLDNAHAGMEPSNPCWAKVSRLHKQSSLRLPHEIHRYMLKEPEKVFLQEGNYFLYNS